VKCPTRLNSPLAMRVPFCFFRSVSAMKNGPYELVVAPNKYPGKRYRDRYAYEHHVVYWQYHGVVPGPNQVIHHKNGEHRDNRIRNLELTTRQNHSARHATYAETVQLKCARCGRKFELSKRTVRSRRKSGYKRFFCNRACYAYKKLACSSIGS
jgi:hypothetical protein